MCVFSYIVCYQVLFNCYGYCNYYSGCHPSGIFGIYIVEVYMYVVSIVVILICGAHANALLLCTKQHACVYVCTAGRFLPTWCALYREIEGRNIMHHVQTHMFGGVLTT